MKPDTKRLRQKYIVYLEFSHFDLYYLYSSTKFSQLFIEFPRLLSYLFIQFQ